MHRMMIIGPCGAGKSTLARTLAEITQLPLIHLDQYYWKPNWEETKKQEWNNVVSSLAQKKKWIIDGNYGGTIDLRLEQADVIIYLDCSTLKCLWRITKRILKYYGKVRPDMPPGCKERFDLAFYNYVASFNLVRRNKLLTKLEAWSDKKQVFIVKNKKEKNILIDFIKS